MNSYIYLFKLLHHIQINHIISTVEAPFSLHTDGVQATEKNVKTVINQKHCSEISTKRA